HAPRRAGVRRGRRGPRAAPRRDQARRARPRRGGGAGRRPGRCPYRPRLKPPTRVFAAGSGAPAPDPAARTREGPGVLSHAVGTLAGVMVQVATPSLVDARAGTGAGAGDLAGAGGFHPAVATWFARRFPGGPTAAQRQGWPAIAAGRDTLIAAPTGSGKTLAGFLVGIDRLYRAHAAGVDVAGRAQVAYVSPLKALAVDIAENLDRPLREIAEVAAE